jgi:hypothetical protein
VTSQGGEEGSQASKPDHGVGERVKVEWWRSWVKEERLGNGIDGGKGAKRQRSEDGRSRGPRTRRWGLD